MGKIKISNNHTSCEVDYENITEETFNNKLTTFNKVDTILRDINKKKSDNLQEIINNIKNSTVPQTLCKDKITLFALLNYFQKKYVFKNFKIYFKNTVLINKLKIDYIKIVVKLNNFPHLLGVTTKRDTFGNIVCKKNPQKFLDGVLYQWLLLTDLEDFVIDFDKLDSFSWIWQTLIMPTYILPKEAIRKEKTKFDADLIFIKRVFKSSKYSFHLVGLRQEKENNFTIVSQFPIRKERFYKINFMFDLNKAYYKFRKSKVKPR